MRGNCKMIVAIDGPGASGKSTTAKLLSKKIKFIHLNTGLLYRGVTYVFIEKKLFVNEDISIDDFFKNNCIELSGKKLNKVMWNGADITNYLSNESINKNINFISNNRSIRTYLINMQRELCLNKNIVCEGRDIGTVVFPNAEYKFYLNASIDSRTNRRYLQLNKNNKNVEKSKIKDNLILRDKNDMERDISPLCKADDAIEIDTTDVSIDEQVLIIYNKIKKGIS